MASRLDQLLSKLASRCDETAISYRDVKYTFGQLETMRLEWRESLESHDIESGEVVALKGDYHPDCIALLLALLQNRNIVALTPQAAKDDEPCLQDSQATGFFQYQGDAPASFTRLENKTNHPLLRELQSRHEGGFIIFSSGSTGQPKAILHGIEPFLAKFENAAKQFSTLAFLVFDHIAGLDTLFYGLASGGALVFPTGRDTRYICQLIQDQQVEVLPASPSFLRLFCVSEAYKSFDLSSLKIVTYGSEPMDTATLERLREILPGVRLIQKYGTSEFGSPRSKTREDGSLWMKMDGEGFRCRIVDDILWVKTDSAMMGYLNAPNPFDEEGWICTGDAVETDGEWMRIIGRKSDLVIVGGEKVYPQEVEAVIMEIDGIKDVRVRGEKHLMMGQVVTAEVECEMAIDDKDLLKLVRRHCRKKLEPYKVPISVSLAKNSLSSSRMKKIRKNPQSG